MKVNIVLEFIWHSVTDTGGGPGAHPFSGETRDRLVVCYTSKIKMDPVFIVIIYDFKFYLLCYILQIWFAL